MENTGLFVIAFAAIAVFLICLISKYSKRLSYEKTKYKFFKGVMPVSKKIDVLLEQYAKCVKDLNEFKALDEITQDELTEFIDILNKINSSATNATNRMESIKKESGKDKILSKRIIDKIDIALNEGFKSADSSTAKAIKETFAMKEKFSINTSDIVTINAEINAIKTDVINKIDSLYKTGDADSGDLVLIDEGVDKLIESRLRLKKAVEELAKARIRLMELNADLQSKLDDLNTWSKESSRKSSLGINDGDNIDTVISKIKTAYDRSYPALDALRELGTWARATEERKASIGVADDDTDYQILDKIKNKWGGLTDNSTEFDSLVNWAKATETRMKALGIVNTDDAKTVINKLKGQLSGDAGVIDIIYTWATSDNIKSDLNITEASPTISSIVSKLKSRYTELKIIEQRAQSVANKLNTLSDSYNVSIQDFNDITDNIVNALNKLTDTESESVTDIDRLKNMLTDYKNIFSADDKVRTKVDSILNDLSGLVTDTTNYDSLLVKVASILRAEAIPTVPEGTENKASDVSMARLNALDSYIKDIKKKGTDMETARDNLQEILDRVNAKLTEYNVSANADVMVRFQEVTGLVTNINAVAQLMNNDSAVSAMTTKTTYMGELYNILNEKLKPFIIGAEKIIADIPANTADSDIFKTSFNKFLSEINQLFTYIKSIDGITATNMEDAKTQLSTMISNLKTQSSRLDFINKKVTDLLTTTRTSQITPSALTGDDEYKNKIMDIESYIIKLEGDLSKKTSDCADLQNMYDTLLGNYNSLSAAVKGLFAKAGVELDADANLINKLRDLGNDINELAINVSSAKSDISAALATIDSKVSSIKTKIRSVVFYMPSGRYMYYDSTGSDDKARTILDLQLGRLGRKARDVYGAPEVLSEVGSDWSHVDGTSFNNALFKGEHAKLYYNNELGKDGNDFSAENNYRFTVPAVPISTTGSTTVSLSDLGSNSCSTIPQVYASTELCNMFMTNDGTNCQYNAEDNMCINVG